MFNDECDCDCSALDDIYLAVASTVSDKIQFEDVSKQTQALYKQLKLQKQLEKDRCLDPQIRKGLQYTNQELIKNIGRSIQSNNIDLASSYMKLTSDQNTNTILDAIQNRAVHLQKNPYGTK